MMATGPTITTDRGHICSGKTRTTQVAEHGGGSHFHKVAGRTTESIGRCISHGNSSK